MTDADGKDPGSGMADRETQNPSQVVADPLQHYPFSEVIDGQPRQPIIKPQPSRPKLLDLLQQRIETFQGNPVQLYAAAGVGLGVLCGVVIAAAPWSSGDAAGPYDLGSLTSSAVGLRGHLFTEWDKKLEYRLGFEPSGKDQAGGFALAVAASPRPLSIGVQLNDAKGFALCSWDIVLRFDPRNAAVLASPAPNALAVKTDSADVATSQLAQGTDFVRLDATEHQREQGKDIFQDEIGPDGQIAAINARGQAPCSRKAYENTASWSFSPNFPSLAEQDELRKRREEILANAPIPIPQKAGARKKIASKSPAKILSFAIEGDDEIVEYDTSREVIETSAGRIFYFDNKREEGTDSSWRDFPVSIHYRCDQSADCTLTHGGAGVLHVRIRR
jgi:hypothetical protein